MIPKGLDETDMKIIEELTQNGRISMTSLGKKVFLTSQAVKNRLERLQDLGIVERYTVNVDCPAFGYQTHGIFYVSATPDHVQDFMDYVKETDHHILHCYDIDQEGHYIIDAHFTGTEEMEDFVRDLSAFSSVTTHKVLKEIHGKHPVDE